MRSARKAKSGSISRYAFLKSRDLWKQSFHVPFHFAVCCSIIHISESYFENSNTVKTWSSRKKNLFTLKQNWSSICVIDISPVRRAVFDVKGETVFFSAVSSMRPIDSTKCVVVQDVKAVTHENAHVHDPISTQIPTEGKYRAVSICIHYAWCKYSGIRRLAVIAFGRRLLRSNGFPGLISAVSYITIQWPHWE